ncbi:MAG TPA: hypothetical protein VFV74_00020 [Burkholderiales bacterium]|nr:hypothetical protein [Burkholderiales bacterium]
MVDRSIQNGAEFLSLTTATAVVYQAVMGEKLEKASVAEMNAILHEVARSLTLVAAVYGRDMESGKLKQLDSLDLLFGVFRRGAAELHTPYAEYGSLCIRRTDMRLGISIIAAAGIRFGTKK